MITKLIRNNKHSNEILNLRNKKYVRIKSFNKKKISKKEHNKWINSFFTKKNKFYGIFLKENFIGYIRIEKKIKTNYISWALSKKYWGKINFYKLLKKKVKKKSTCFIKKNNISSQIVALKAGFKVFKVKKEYIVFIK